MGRGLSATTVLLAPMGLILACAAVPIVTVVFGRGEFDAADVRRTAVAVSWYAPALVALGWREVVVRASYAVGDARGPVTIAVVAMTINVVGDLTAGRHWGIPGLAASTSLSLIVAAAASTWQLSRRHQVRTPLGGLLIRNLSAVLLAGGAGVAAGRLTDAAEVAGTWNALGDGALVAVAVLSVYAGVLRLWGAPEGRDLVVAARSLRR